ncbi:MAG: uncharacterized protein KVP18_001627 [Porospora cf. gigantea A]|uniref:uncharacterized protein n=1 Tax=Porospora cf. gigantea A TaxID=2853593 RepID=UPI00355A68E4|nr:MAG: hypothetical protein KVP18_001627 [Porospora cf. gigantea A]
MRFLTFFFSLPAYGSFALHQLVHAPKLESKATILSLVSKISMDSSTARWSEESISSNPRGVLSSFTASVAVTVSSEVGDRTFFITALLARKYPNKFCVWLGSVSALLIQTSLSVLLGGQALQFLHVSNDSISLVSGCLLIIFALYSFREALETSEEEDAFSQLNTALINKESPEISWWALLTTTFWVVFTAEFGDKSMLSTITLASSFNWVGVFLGVMLAHALVSLAAVFLGTVLQPYVDERRMNLISGVLFLVIGLSLCVDAF